MIDPFSAMLVAQAIKLLAGPAGAAWDQFATRLGSSVGGAAADKVTNWLLRGGGGGLSDSDLLEMRNDDQASSALRGSLERHLGVTLTPTGVSAGYENQDTVIVAGYEAVLWRVASLAYIENRPIVVDGALQGLGWLTLCIPTPISPRHGALPDPNGIWSRSDGPPRLDRPTFSLADIYVLAPSVDGRENVRDGLNLRYRREPKDVGRPDAPGTAPRDQWHRIEAIESTWVQLEPDGPADSVIEDRSGDPSSVRMDWLRHDWYPDDWYPLIDIPDEVQGMVALSAGADAFAAKSVGLKQRVAAILEAT